MWRVKSDKNAFTLAELLIALTILAVIATFTIPKILTAQADQQKKALIRETISALTDIYYTGYVNGGIYPDGTGGWNVWAYEEPRLNYTKRCSWSAHTTGCWPQDDSINTSEDAEGGYVLANGVTLAGTGSTGVSCNGFLMDWNGDKPPNVAGDDQMYLQVCYGSGNKRGVVFAHSASPVTKTLYEWAFSN